MTSAVWPRAPVLNIWRWTVDRYERAAMGGLFGPQPHVELINGEVIEMAPMGPMHAEFTRRVSRVFSALSDVAWTVGGQQPVRVADDSQPEPDAWIARGGRGTYLNRHPGLGDLVLAVEVADSSLALDRTTKLALYARAAIAHYWIIDVNAGEILVFGDPDPGAAVYRTAGVVASGGRLEVPEVPLSVVAADILD